MGVCAWEYVSGWIVCVVGSGSFGISTKRAGRCEFFGGDPSWVGGSVPASAPLVWFGVGQCVIVMLETTKSRLRPGPLQWS